ncbi:hypothetical protein GCM10008090_17570 [Arenicella chitinivorans]|uniref:JmjC domain-containing protein n=1 Tax=Arenicella chitinivorans TaxID=1329800 RepID=A0A918RSJ9_9GAMM|nr:cupin-like domain-containing protein [Arenicella chitinivorans]GHA08210.1 hypothetical protein GCM10008090_17570 [Arenicella chitinivorans]
MQLEILDQLSQNQFVVEHIAANQPCVIKDVNFDAANWTSSAFKERVGDLTTQVYDTLFELQDIATLGSYLERYFEKPGQPGQAAPYVRWYNRLKDVEFPWGDEAFERLNECWVLPDCIPKTELLVPLARHGRQANPVFDLFPYRGVLVAARGARTRLHRDPFFSDAIVNQFSGVKEYLLYHPDRTDELKQGPDSSSFGGFIDVRDPNSAEPLVEPDYRGLVHPGELLYIPHGWLHDVMVVEDSISITWNFIHQAGSAKFRQYLHDGPEADPEFEVLKYFYAHAGTKVSEVQDVLAQLDDVNQVDAPLVQSA